MNAMKPNKYPSQNQSGFTIVELMIATAVLSVILLISTVVIVGIGRLYYKGINQSRVQGTVRSVGDEIAQKLQLNTAPVQHNEPSPPDDANMKAYCIGSTRYSYVEGVKIGTKKGGPTGQGPYYHVLWRDILPSGGECKPQNLKLPDPGGVEGQELISPNSRLTQFSITGSGGGSAIESPYNVVIGVAYGDDDLLSSGPNVTCQGSAGGQFCATAKLSTTVVQRTTD